MGYIRKALFIATAGLSGRVFKDDSKKQSTAKADANKRARSQKQNKAARPKPQARRKARARTTPQARRKPQASPEPQALRTSTASPVTASGNGTTRELERLADLHGRGALTNEEFAAAKAKILGASPTSPEPGRDPATFPSVEANVAAARRLAELAARDDTSVTTHSSD